MNPNYENEREIAVRAVREAAHLCRAVRHRLAPESMVKKDLSPVTVADYGSQALIGSTLAEAFPNDPVIAEEDSSDLRRPENVEMLQQLLREILAQRPGTGTDNLCTWIDHGNTSEYSDRFWTLDPIDGTKGFLRAEQYAIALALVVQGRVVVSALACPNLPLTASAVGPVGVIFDACRGSGVSRRPIDGEGPIEPVKVSDQDDPTRARFCESVEAAHSAQGESAMAAARLGILVPPVRLDSQAKYAVVASGGAEIYLRLPTRADYREKIWDHAAGALLVEEAGGKVTDADGLPLDFTLGRELAANRGIVATNGRLHDQILGALGPVERRP
ncbi:3'(2'),5'-bisphosphate nucleotidase [soil metagenome]